MSHDQETREPRRGRSGGVREMFMPGGVNTPINTQKPAKAQLRLIENEPPEPAPRIDVMIAGMGWGRAGPFRLTERHFHELCREARRLEARQ